jgi:hypothetical protein
VSSVVRTRWVRTASFAGAVAAVEHLVAHPGDRVGAAKAVDAASRLANLDAYLASLRRRADAIKAQVGLGALKRLAADRVTARADAAVLRDLVADLVTSRDLAVIDELEVLESATRDATVLDSAERVELDRLFTAGSPRARLGLDEDTPTSDAAALAFAAGLRWQSKANGWGSPQRRQAAKVARRTYMSLWEHLTSDPMGVEP